MSSPIANSTLTPFAGLTPSDAKQLMAFVYYGDSASDALGYALSDFDFFMQSQMVTCIHSGVRIAAAVLVSGLLFLIARSYVSLLFLCYQMNFLLMLIGAALELGWVFSFNASIAEFVTNINPPKSDLNVSMAASAFQTMLMLTILAGLVFQIYVAFSDQRRSVQLSVTAFASVGCFPAYLILIWRLTAIGMDLFGAGHGRYNYGIGAITGNYHPSSASWTFEGIWRAFTASVGFCAIILCVKLYLVHRRREKLGVTKINPIKILTIMALHNSIIPLILAIISSAMSVYNAGGTSIAAATIPITACLQPIGYIWAQYNMHYCDGSRVKTTIDREDHEVASFSSHISTAYTNSPTSLTYSAKDSIFRKTDSR